MKQAVVLCCSASWYALSCAAQTNTCVEAKPDFFFPPIQLRLEVRPEPAKTQPLASLSLTPAVTIPAVALNSTLGDWELKSRVLRSGEFYLTRPEPTPDGALTRAVEGIFKPEVLHLGKVPIASSIVTAIKRKNPLCLLNPIVFQVSW